MTGPLRRGGALVAGTGLNYAAIGATASPGVLAFPPEGFRAAQYRHRLGSGSRRFEIAGRALMTWGALRGAGFGVLDIRAEEAPHPGAGAPLFLDDGTPWITPGMTALVTAGGEVESSGPVKVVTVVDETAGTARSGAARTGYVYGTRPGHPSCGERLLLLEHDREDAVWLILRSMWRTTGGRLSLTARRADLLQRRVDERIVRALHPSNVG